MTRPWNLLWVDCTAAAVVGVVMLALRGWLSRLYALSEELVLLIGAANLLYAVYSFSLAVRRPPRPMPLVRFLVFANLFWVGVCGVLAAYFWRTASPFGLAQLIGEGLFVGTLAGFEWRRRDQLVTAP